MKNKKWVVILLERNNQNIASITMLRTRKLVISAVVIQNFFELVCYLKMLILGWLGCASCLQVQKYCPASEEHLSPDLQEWAPYSPKRSTRHSDGFAPSSLYAGGMSAG